MGADHSDDCHEIYAIMQRVTYSEGGKLNWEQPFEGKWEVHAFPSQSYYYLPVLKREILIEHHFKSSSEQ